VSPLRETIPADHSLEEIRRHLGVDTLGYLSLAGMLRAAGGDPSEFCHACFSGDYPTEIPDDSGPGRHDLPLVTAIPV
jgi:amidophosphoribosyltransferase